MEENMNNNDKEHCPLCGLYVDYRMNAERAIHHFKCPNCGEPTSQKQCKACILKEKIL